MAEDTSGIRRIVCKIADTAAPKGIVTGWAYVTTDDSGKQIVDYSGEYVTFDDIEDAFERAFAPGSEPNPGVLHLADGGGRIIGQITLSSAEREALGFGPGQEGAIIKVRVTDPKLLALIRAGKLTAFSIEGSAEEIEDDGDET